MAAQAHRPCREPVVPTSAGWYGPSSPDPMPRKTPDIRSADVPQAPSLARIRAVVTAVAAGAATLDVIAEETDISARHVGHDARAAQALALLDGKRAPTVRGQALLATDQGEPRGSLAAFPAPPSRRARSSGTLAPSLLAEKPPSEEDARRPDRAAHRPVPPRPPSTARVEDLLAWREQILEED